MKNITPIIDGREIANIIRRDPFLFARVRKLAAQRGQTINQLVAAVCRQALGRSPHGK